MAAGNTYTQIAKTTIGSAVSSYTFSSIPATYTDLVLVFNGSNAIGNDAYLIYVNGLVSNIYSATYLEADGSTVYSARWSGRSDIPVARGASDTAGADLVTVEFLNYANSSVFKSLLARYSLGGTLGARTSATVGVVGTLNSINSITFKSNASNLSVGSTLALYGITAA